MCNASQGQAGATGDLPRAAAEVFRATSHHLITAGKRKIERFACRTEILRAAFPETSLHCALVVPGAPESGYVVCVSRVREFGLKYPEGEMLAELGMG